MIVTLFIGNKVINQLMFSKHHKPWGVFKLLQNVPKERISLREMQVKDYNLYFHIHKK